MNRSMIIAVGCAVVIGCTDNSEPLATGTPQYAKPPAGPTDPTSSWLIPLDATGLGFGSDGKYASGGYSVYANGVCGVDSKIFATTAASNSGDAIMQTDNPKYSDRKCSRRVVFTYDDNTSEAVNFFGNLGNIENTTTTIPIGTTETRPLNLSSSSSSSRCGVIRFRTTLRTGEYVGGDSVLVTRVDAKTWEVKTQDYPNDKGYCDNLAGPIHLPVHFFVVAN